METPFGSSPLSLHSTQQHALTPTAMGPPLAQLNILMSDVAALPAAMKGLLEPGLRHMLLQLKLERILAHELSGCEKDVAARIMSFSQHGARSICSLTANGAISNVTLHQAATSGGTVTYEERFEILSLSGSFLLSESGGQQRTGGLSVSLAGPDGRVMGGDVADLLTAASPVQVIVGSFTAEGLKEAKLPGFAEPSSRQAWGASSTDSPASSRRTLSSSSGMPVSPLCRSTSVFNHNNNMQGLAHLNWK